MELYVGIIIGRTPGDISIGKVSDSYQSVADTMSGMRLPPWGRFIIRKASCVELTRAAQADVTEDTEYRWLRETVTQRFAESEDDVSNTAVQSRITCVTNRAWDNIRKGGLSEDEAIDIAMKNKIVFS